MINLPLQMPTRFVPTRETLTVLNERTWLCSYSGGKDSTSLVTWIEWLRRVGLVKCATPRLVLSDTTVEYPFLRDISQRTMDTLTMSGWHCEVVTPKVHERLYCRIFGVGNTPVHPGGRKMRWCSRSTKIDPMKRFAKTIGEDVVQLSGLRFGESDVRDQKLTARGCAAGGECGLPEPGEGVFLPILTWTVCKVIDWLSGKADDGVNAALADLLPMMKELVSVYEVRREQEGFFGIPPKTTALRFGCIGCPAITRSRVIAGKAASKHPRWVALRRLWAMWQELYLRKNRCCRVKDRPQKRGKTWPDRRSDRIGYGPLRMAARQKYFAELLDIQRESGVTLVTAEDEAFIRECWEKKVYPRGWSEADELVEPPAEGLFGEIT